MPDFFDEEKKTLLQTYWVIPAFFILAMIGFWVATSIYFWNIQALRGAEAHIPPFVELLTNSAYLSVVFFGTIALIYKQIEPRIIH